MTKKDEIFISGYDYFNKRFTGDGGDSYKIGYLLDLIDDASDWNEEVLKGFTAAHVLANIVYKLGLGTKCGETPDDILEAVKQAVE